MWFGAVKFHVEEGLHKAKKNKKMVYIFFTTNSNYFEIYIIYFIVVVI